MAKRPKFRREYERDKDYFFNDSDQPIPYFDIRAAKNNDDPFFLQENNNTISYEMRPVKRSRNDMTMWECSASYMRVMHYKYSESTKDGLWRRYKRITKDIYVLAQMGKLSTIVPEKMMKEDIHNYLLYRRSFGVSDSEMEHELSALSKIFEYVGNPNFSNALKEFPYLRTTGSHKKLPPMEEPEWRAILNAADLVSSNDWDSMVSYATVIFAFCSGLRARELAMCDIGCVKTKEKLWVVEVLHPKGERTYGQKRLSPIIHAGYRFLRRYFVARERHIEEKKIDSRALLVGSHSDAGHLSPSTLRLYAANVAKWTGIDVNLRKCRRTYGQTLLDLGTPISDVSVVMGHSNTRTTECYYARTKFVYAIQNISEKLGKMLDEDPDCHLQFPRGFEDSVKDSPEDDDQNEESLEKILQEFDRMR